MTTASFTRMEEELSAPLPDLRRRGPLGRAADGLMLLLRGQRLALPHPRIKKLSLAVIAITGFVYAAPVAVGSLALFLLDDKVKQTIAAHDHPTG